MGNGGGNDGAGATHGIDKCAAHCLVGVVGRKQVNIGQLQIFEQNGQCEVFIDKYHMIGKIILLYLLLKHFPVFFPLRFHHFGMGFADDQKYHLRILLNNGW